MFKFVQRKIITNMKNFLYALFMVLIVIDFNKSWAQNSCLDPTFGIAGISIHSFGSDSITAKSIDIQNDGKIIVAGYIKDSINTDFFFFDFILMEILTVVSEHLELSEPIMPAVQ